MINIYAHGTVAPPPQPSKPTREPTWWERLMGKQK